MTKEFIAEMKEKLLMQKAKLTAELKSIAVHTEMGDEVEANADEVNVDEVNRDVIVLIQTDLLKIDKALEKIANGIYGTDDEGKEISMDRLRVMPWADKAL